MNHCKELERLVFEYCAEHQVNARDALYFYRAGMLAMCIAWGMKEEAFRKVLTTTLDDFNAYHKITGIIPQELKMQTDQPDH